MDLSFALSPAAYGYTATAGACFSLSTLAGKKAAGFAAPAVVMFVYMIPCTLTGLLWLLLQPDLRLTPAYWLPFSVSLAANVVANLSYLRALKTAQASLAGCALGLVPFFAALVAWAALGETLAPRQWLGIALSFIGLAAMYVPARAAGGGARDFLFFFRRADGWCMLAAAFCWAVASPCDKAAAAASSPQLHCFLIYAAMLPPSFLIIVLQGRLPELRLPRAHAAVISGAGALRGAGFAAQLLALLITPVGVLETVKRVVQQIVSLAGGKIFYDEPVTGFKIFGTLIFFCAVPLVVFA